MADERSCKRGERELAAFMQECQRKLDENTHKGTWKDEDSFVLYDLLSEEMAELWVELRAEMKEGRVNVDAVRSECADISLFAMMIADVAEGLEATYKEVK